MPLQRPYGGPNFGTAPVIQVNPDQVSATVYPFTYFGQTGDDGASVTTALATYNVVDLVALTYVFNTTPAPTASQVVYGQPGTVSSGTAGFTTFKVASSPPAVGPSDQNLLAWNYDPVAGQSNSLALATGGTMYVCAVPIRNQISVTNIVYDFETVGNTLTSGQCFAALYAGVGGAKVGVSADQSGTWVGSTGLLTTALTGGPFNVSPGTAYVGFWFNGTTGPSFRRANTTVSNNAGLAATASRFGTANTGLTNLASAPGTLGTISASAANSFWVALS